MTHLLRPDTGRTYCDTRSGVLADPLEVTCAACRRLMTADYCDRCGLLHVAWDYEDVCVCEKLNENIVTVK